MAVIVNSRNQEAALYEQPLRAAASRVPGLQLEILKASTARRDRFGIRDAGAAQGQRRDRRVRSPAPGIGTVSSFISVDGMMLHPGRPKVTASRQRPREARGRGGVGETWRNPPKQAERAIVQS
jgi:hypothetical protein